jgi:hypothetical protein
MLGDGDRIRVTRAHRSGQIGFGDGERTRVTAEKRRRVAT